jgi:hypothetical protein
VKKKKKTTQKGKVNAYTPTVLEGGQGAFSMPPWTTALIMTPGDRARYVQEYPARVLSVSQQMNESTLRGSSSRAYLCHP